MQATKGISSLSFLEKLGFCKMFMSTKKLRRANSFRALS